MASQGHASIQLRLKHDLKAKVIASAVANHRSINAEIAHQLDRAYTPVLVSPYFGPQQPGWPDRDPEIRGSG